MYSQVVEVCDEAKQEKKRKKIILNFFLIFFFYNEEQRRWKILTVLEKQARHSIVLMNIGV